MSIPEFESLSEEERAWLDTYLDGTISPDSFDSLQNRMASSRTLRRIMRRYLSLDNSLATDGSDQAPFLEAWVEQENSTQNVIRFPGLLRIAAVATLAFLLGSALMYWVSRPEVNLAGSLEADEPSAQGFAVINQLVSATWPEGTTSRIEGESLGDEVFRLASGLAEIQFFSGAVMTVQAPAEIFLKSAWEAECREGSVRLRVPPAARGFRLHGPSTEIVDLGTEFGLEIRDGKGQVEVFDGEIELRHRDGQKQLVRKGSALSLPPDGSASPNLPGRIQFPDGADFGTEESKLRRAAFERAKRVAGKFAADRRLLAYYTFDLENPGDPIANLASLGNTHSDGAVILAESVSGRWQDSASALEFRRPGSRVRVNLPGEFPAFTFMCWVRIDSLDRRFNALFMGDGYENGEPHWQIRNDGKIMLSIMIDEARPSGYKNDSAGFHRVYFSPPMWDLSMSGQWLHLASVYDPVGQKVSHFVDGKRIAQEVIENEHLVTDLRIGNGEIGNWGLPFREDPNFAIRNLNGRMDEIAIFRAALGDEEIAEIYERSRPGRH